MSRRYWAALLIVLFGLASVHAQPADKDSDKTDGNKPAAGNPLTFFKGGRLSADEPNQKDLREFDKMVRGADDPPITGDRRKELFDKVLRYLIYRLTWENIHEGLEPITTRDIMEGSRTGTMDGIFKAFPPPTFNKQAEDPEEAAKRQRQQKYLAEMRGYATEYLREVLKNRLLIARLNAAIVFHRLAEYGQEEILDDLIAIIENPNEHDAVKHWAIKSVNELFTANAGKKPKDPQRMDNAALAVYRWLDEHTRTPPTLLAELSEPEKDGIRYIRREAIRTLGNYRKPVIIDDPKAGRREGPTAELLLRIMNNQENSVLPEASLTERKEAAEALCYLQGKNAPNYQQDYVAFQVGRFIALLGAEASRDPSRTNQRWKAFADHLKAATDALSADVGKNSPHSAYVGKILDRIQPVLENLFDDRLATTAVGDLNEHLNTSPPKSTELFGKPPMKNN